MSTAGSPHDRAIARVAARQYGIITRAQLSDLGLTSDAIDLRVNSARLRRLHRGVYAVGASVLTPNGHRLAAVLACGPSAVLSHRSAGAAWGLLGTAQTVIDVTVPAKSADARRGIRVHRTRSLHPDDIQVLDGIPITSIARTIVDLAGVLRPAQLLRAIEQAARLRKLDFKRLQATIDRAPNRKGMKALGIILADFTAPPVTRSELERDFLEVVTDAGLPAPRLNVKVGGFEVDACWPKWDLVVELDGRAYHSDPGAFERDRFRDGRLQRAGKHVLRVTHKRLHREPEEVIADIRGFAALAERRAAG
jgi:very-short-patch-repair endonuclease/predicted transcriptional regulator of viral defense system